MPFRGSNREEWLMCAGQACEGCQKPATTQDCEGVPLCSECMNELIESTVRDAANEVGLRIVDVD